MTEKVEKNLARAFAEESKASARNSAFALKAEREGYPALARLFRAVADAESIHARRFLFLMRAKIGTTAENLESAIQHELQAGQEGYPPMVEEARDSSKAVKKAFTQSMQTDGEHAGLYREAKQDMLAGKDVEYYVCQICGHIEEGFIPENCPICNAVSGRFKRVV
ncbi:rubrerythrin family protein [Thermodesulfobacteriota bacterium]